MKTNPFLKAIAFLTAVFVSVLLFSSCEHELPSVETISVESQNNGAVIKVSAKIISDGGTDIIRRGFCLSQHPNPSISDLIYEATDQSAIFAHNFTDLERNATYYVRAYAENSAGLAYGEVLEVYTATQALAETLGAEVGIDEAVLRAKINGYNSPLEVWFEVWRPDEPRRKVIVEGLDNPTEIKVSAQIEGLTRGETYSYAVYAQNSQGTIVGETKTFKLYYTQASDYDGNKYWAVKIGEQVWLTENLKTTHFLNGDPIPNITGSREWAQATGPAYCYYDNDPSLGEKYGALYNYYVGADPRGLVEGFRAMVDDDYIKMRRIAEVYELMAEGEWFKEYGSPVSGITNATGFSALPGGCRITTAWQEGQSIDSKFILIHEKGYFWTTRLVTSAASFFSVDMYKILSAGPLASKDNGFSLRLLQQ